MKNFLRLALYMVMATAILSLSAQNYKTDKLKKAVDIMGIQVVPDSLLPDTTFLLAAKDGRIICLRTDSIKVIEHVGIPLFSDMIRLLQPSPVYDFLEYAVLNWKYQITPNQLYLSKVIFKSGSWDTLLRNKLNEYTCTIENCEEKLYIVTWKREEKDIAVIGIPIEYELLNNDTRRNMERTFVKDLENSKPAITKPNTAVVDEKNLSIYGTEGLFVIPGKSYIIDFLNQNNYYKLTTVYETVDTIIHKKPVTMSMEAVLPVVVIDSEFPAETFANLMMCNDVSIPEVTMDLDFHLSNYHREKITMPLSQLKAFCSQQGCSFYFACEGTQNNQTKAVMFASNTQEGYNHLFSLRTRSEELTSDAPVVRADVYLYIPPISREKLFGKAPTQKSNIKFKLP